VRGGGQRAETLRLADPASCTFNELVRGQRAETAVQPTRRVTAPVDELHRLADPASCTSGRPGELHVSSTWRVTVWRSPL
jgi:hypothetical protein